MLVINSYYIRPSLSPFNPTISSHVGSERCQEYAKVSMLLELSRICSQLFSYDPETSKRATTAHRAKVKRKVVETRKKSKKAAKKDHTWKSSAYSYICALFIILVILFSLREAKRSWHPE
jgi:hypothetical protein